MAGLTNVDVVSIAAPATFVTGVVWLKGDLYSADAVSNIITRHVGFSINTTGSITGPGGAAGMLTTDGTNIIVADIDTDLVYVLDGFSTNVLVSFSTPAGATLSGLAFDGVNLIISDSVNNVVYVMEGISGTAQYSFPIASGAFDFVDIVVDPSGGFIGSDIADNSIYFYDHPITFDHSSSSWDIEESLAIIESSDRGGSQFFVTGGSSAEEIPGLVIDVYQDLSGTDIFYGSFSAMEKCFLGDDLNGEITWSGTRNRGRLIAGQVTITRSDGGAADKFYELAIVINGIVQKDSVSLGSLPNVGTILTLSTLPITRDLVKDNLIKLQIRTLSTPATTEAFSSRLSIN